MGVAVNIISNGHVINNLTSHIIGNFKKEVYIDTYRITSFELQSNFKNHIICPVFRLYLLNNDETIKKDVSEYLMSGTLSINYQNGQRRALNITLHDYDEVWNPSPYSGWLWNQTRFRFDAGVLIEDTIYWARQGIFVVKDPSHSYQGGDNTISLSLVDKFGLYDGTVSGNTEWYYKIPVNTSIRDAISGCIYGDYGRNEIYDQQPIYMNTAYQNELLAYTISKNPDTCISEILLSLAEMISCDIYYNEFGCLTVTSGIDELASVNRPIIYRFTDGDREIRNASVTHNWSQVKNKVIVNGAVVNGDIFTGIAENTNPASRFCVQNFGTHIKYISDTNIYSEQLALDRATYELLQSLRKCENINFTTNYLPHIDVNKLVEIHSDALGISDGLYLVNSVNMNISTSGEISWTVSSVQEGLYAA